MHYLDKEEINRARYCTLDIKDRLQAIMSELALVEKPNKRYLMEKLNCIDSDVQCLISMCKEGGNDEEHS